MHCRGFGWVELYFTPPLCLRALNRGDLTFYPPCCYVYEPVLACCWDELLILSVRRLISVCSYAHGDGIEVDSRWRWVAGFAAVRPEKVPCYPLNRRLLGPRASLDTEEEKLSHYRESSFCCLQSSSPLPSYNTTWAVPGPRACAVDSGELE